MKQWLKDYFAFNKKERNGVLALLGMIILTLGTTALINWKATYGTLDPAIHMEEDEEVMAKEVVETRPGIGQTTAPPPEKIDENGLFEFDPNTLNLNGWIKLGLTDNQAQTIINYRNAGMEFRKKEDLKKAYSIDAEMYAKLEPYIRIDRPGFPVELNTADSSQLVKVYGIGPARAKDIIDYRQALGGFHSTSQLMDIYGIGTKTYEEIKTETTTDVKHIRKIDINQATREQLEAHPYIKKKLAKSIIAYRNDKGNFSAVTEIKEKGLVNEDLYRKLAPYLSVE